jgi:hypothetical protein
MQFLNSKHMVYMVLILCRFIFKSWICIFIQCVGSYLETESSRIGQDCVRLSFEIISEYTY